MVSNAVVHGYYRSTDVHWEWQKVIPEEAVQPLKSFIHSESITHPDHPFYNPTLGGVELFIGVLPDNESRILYSSKQLEYLRYWIKEMGFLDYLIPLPHSDCLLTRDVLQSVAPVVIKTPGEMKTQQKQIDKLNKRLRGAVDAKLAALRSLFERTRAAYGTCQGTWIAADFEAWERDHEIITEFGFAEMKWLPAKDDTKPEGTKSGEKTVSTSNMASQLKLEPVITRTGHWIVKENQSYRNGVYVEDSRNRFAFGKSETIPRSEFIERIRNLLQPPEPKGPIYLVFHDYSQDMAYLMKPKYKLEILNREPTLILPDIPAENGLFVIDTSQMFSALEGDADQKRKLEDVYRRLKHTVLYDLHNAGNDAKYTLDILQEMATGGPLDAQRERRWPPPPPEPGQPAKKTVKVEDWRPEDESDYEDTETLLGGPYWRQKQAKEAPKAAEAAAAAKGEENDGSEMSTIENAAVEEYLQREEAVV